MTALERGERVTEEAVITIGIPDEWCDWVQTYLLRHRITRDEVIVRALTALRLIEERAGYRGE